MLMTLAIFLGFVVILFLVGFPVSYAIGLTSLAVLIYERGILNIPFEIIAQRIVYGVNNFTLLAIPFFFTGRQVDEYRKYYKKNL